MQKNSFLVKTTSILILVLIIGYGCVPTGGNPVPVTTFNVDINSNVDIRSPNTPLGNGDSNILIIDNDSLIFRIVYEYGSGYGTIIFGISYNSSNGSNFEYLTNNLASVQMEDLPYGTNLVRLDSGHYWKPAVDFGTGNGFERAMFRAELNTLTHPTLNLPLDTDRYFVFRKQKASSYQYYWLRARLRYDSVLVDSVLQHNGNIFDINNGYVVDILNGKFQMDSIITGL